MREILLTTLLLTYVSQAYGTTYLEYNGAVFTQFNGSVSSGTPGQPFLSMVIAMPDGLTDGLTIDEADVEKIEIQLLEIVVDDSQLSSASITVVIGPDLLPSSWSFDLRGNLTGGPGDEQIFSGQTSTPGVFANSYSVDGTVLSNSGSAMSLAGNYQDLGTWNLVPTPGTASCLIGGAAMMLGSRSKSGRR